MASLWRAITHPDAWLYLAITGLAAAALILLAQLSVDRGLLGIDQPPPPVGASIALEATLDPSPTAVATDDLALTATAIVAGSSPTPVPTFTETPTETVTPLPEPTATLQMARTHVVQSGENLYRISQNYGITTEALAAANGLSVTETIFVGQVLTIPEAGSFTVAMAATPLTQPTFLPTLTHAPEQVVSVASIGIIEPTATIVLPPPDMVNGVPMSDVVYMPPNVIDNTRALYRYGQTLGRNPRAFSKVGDSTIEPPHFLTRFDEGPYNLGNYAYLQPVIDYYHGSFQHNSMAVRRGMHTWSALDPMWAGVGCSAGENPIECEIRLYNPSVMILRLGSNDRGVPNMTADNIREIVEICIRNGVVPILGTKADRFEGNDSTNIVIRQIAADYRVPLWDFDRVAQTVPGRGLGPDGVHLSIFYAHDWTLSSAWTQGHAFHNLTALMALYEVWQVVEGV